LSRGKPGYAWYTRGPGAHREPGWLAVARLCEQTPSMLAVGPAERPKGGAVTRGVAFEAFEVRLTHVEAAAVVEPTGRTPAAGAVAEVGVAGGWGQPLWGGGHGGSIGGNWRAVNLPPCRCSGTILVVGGQASSCEEGWGVQPGLSPRSRREGGLPGPPNADPSPTQLVRRFGRRF